MDQRIASTLKDRLRSATALVSAASLLVMQSTGAALALPAGGQVSAGSASISSSSANQMDVNQSSQRAILDWGSFNINNGQTVNFNQPNSSAIALNRIHDVNPSRIDGSLNANGQVWLVNSQGIAFGSGAQVNVGGLLATSSDIDNNRFMSGDYAFDKPGNPFASILNAGRIQIADRGLAALVGPNVTNGGLIEATLGKVQLASGDTFALDLYGDGLINLQASPAITSQLVNNSGTIAAGGGQVLLTAAAAGNAVSSLVNLGGAVQGDHISVSGDVVGITGTLDTLGAAGGDINIDAHNVSQQGTLAADGGSVHVGFTGGFIDSEGSTISAGGGTISLEGGGQSNLFASGRYNAQGAAGGQGGDITFQADQIRLYGARLDASGDAGGGTIRVGGDYQGGGAMPHASLTHVNFSSVLKADALSGGDGGRVIVWSDGETGFAGTATAKAGVLGGDGGLIELSSAGTLATGGHLDASSPWGLAGRVLLDPKNITISNSGLMGGLVQFELVDPNAAGGNNFGGVVRTLSTGNVVVTSTGDDFAASNAGAVYLFNGATGGLISTLRGSSANDQAGSGGVTVLVGGNYVVGSSNWDNGAVANAGAVTWGSGATGITGTISAANSLVGTQASDNVGNSGVYALAGGNYVVASQYWANGAAAQAGAVTWGNGATGTAGAVSAANSLVGTQVFDSVGNSGVRALTNGNYVVNSTYWANGGATQAGAVTWGNGATGTVGAVSAANSLVGTQANDNVGLSGVYALAGGNYVVASQNWDNGAVANAGAATWGDGATGTVGAVSAANSLVGTQANDRVGIFGAKALTNGNYVVLSPYWANGAAANAGAATWGSGATGITGTISAANSLVGSQASDGVGTSGVTTLTNGNYVVASASWKNGAAANAGAVTWGSGTTGITGTISAANSLVGTQASDLVGNNGVTALTNGNYVVSSAFWNNGAATQAGAVTWGNGATGTAGAVSAANSLVGTQTIDRVGSIGVTALANGNYVVASPYWDNGAVADVGAATWGDGATGITGTISAANSLVGSQASGYVGYLGVTALTNGNYVVISPYWNNGAATYAGAATWGNGAAGTMGAVSAANSLVGTQANDNVGLTGVTALTNGNYVVKSGNWANGSATLAGAVTWGSGTAGVSGAITSANSILGPVANANLGAIVEDTANGTFITPFRGAGRVYVASVNGPVSLGSYDSFADMAGASVTLHPSFLTATLNTGSNVTLQASNDITVNDAVTVNNPGGNGGTLTLQAGRSILLNADITTDNGDLNLFANEKAATGVVNAQRDPGNAVITMASGVSINAGTGAVTFRLDDGAGNTNRGAGDITLRSVTGASILAQNANSTGDVVLGGGLLAASGAGDAIRLASSRNFINNAGAGALSTPAGRWLVYSTSPGSDSTGALTSAFTRFGCVFGGSCPAFPGTGDGSLYSSTPGGISSLPTALPPSVVDIISGSIGTTFLLAAPSRMILADLRLLDSLGLKPDMPDRWWDGVMW